MEVILLERVEKLGTMGAVVNVRPGFARNFLLPKRKALRATKENKAYFEQQKAQIEAQNLTRKQEAEEVAGRMRGLTLTAIRAASETGHLYGAVSTKEVAGLLAEQGFAVQRNQIKIDQPIKTIGLHNIEVVLHGEVSITVTINVGKSAEEAQAQLNQSGEIA